jgi:hypothetical protein
MANDTKDGMRRFCVLKLISVLILVSCLTPCFSLTTVEPFNCSNLQLYLLSLKYVPEVVRDEATLYYHSSKPVRELWKWKDTILGDGRDFFVPKPRTLAALQNYILDHCPSLAGQELSECVILSNCARFEIIVVCQANNNQHTNVTSIETGNCAKELLRQEKLAEEISRCLLVQMSYYSVKQQERGGWQGVFLLDAATMNMATDRPQDVLTMNAPGSLYHEWDNHATSSLLLSYWDVRVGAECILPHLCRVASGMASSPKRPDRTVLFRPFSSRDSHILLQLKRTRESCMERRNPMLVKTGGNGGPSFDRRSRQRRRLPMLLEYALRAGKDARNPRIVPELESLRAEYKSSSSSPVISTKDLEQSVRVADVAYSKAIQPLIREYLHKEQMSMYNVNQEIAHLRNLCLAIVCSEQEDDLRWMTRRLHGLILELRNYGRLINYSSSEECFLAIQEELEIFRHAKKVSVRNPTSVT